MAHEHTMIGTGNWWMVAIGLAFWAGVAAAQQAADLDFDTTVNKPAYAADGPRVLFDKAHNNFHTANGRYKPFADLIRNDGFRITPNKDAFTLESLHAHDILVIANAMGPIGKKDSKREFEPAFTDAECDVVRDWVRGGGRLLLIADHFPMGSAAEILAKRFDVLMSKGMTDEYSFTAERGLAAEHPIMRGRNPEESIKVLRTFTGQSLQGPPDATILITLPTDAKEMTPDPQNPDKGKPIEGKAIYPAQGLAFQFGKGRVVVLGEAGMLTAQVASNGEKFGMNAPGFDNRQFALNTMHWLAGSID